jgi:excisionase family DNA binding protein
MDKLGRFTVREAALELGRSEPTIYRWIDEGRIQAVRVRRSYFIPVSEIERIRIRIKKEPV